MENIIKNRYFKFLFWIFIILSLVHIVYATITMRGLYADGTYYLFSSLHHFTQGTIKTSFDHTHPRAFIELLHNLPITISYYILQIKSKYALILIYCASLVALPFLTLLWNYKLSHRTKRYDIFYSRFDEWRERISWNLFRTSSFV